jgi:hypothetical protein
LGLEMPTLHFLPWCRLDKQYSVGDATLIPFERSKPPPELDDLTTYPIKLIMNSYRGSTGHPVRQFAIVKFNERTVLDDLNEEDRECLWGSVALACLTALSQRDFIGGHGPYCNADCFLLYRQRFEKQPDFAAITTRRRDSAYNTGTALTTLSVEIPIHVAPIPTPLSLDERLLQGLSALRNKLLKSEKERWEVWQDAIIFFNQANTDAENVRWQVEWVLMSAAFQRLLQTGHNEKKTAKGFPDALPLAQGVVQSVDRTLLNDWLMEFQRLRGDFAHGKSQTQKQHRWSQSYHLIIAAVAFPLLVRSLLAKENVYKFDDRDFGLILAFEALLKQALNPGSGQKSWLNLIAEGNLTVACFHAAQELTARGQSGENGR